MTLRKEVHHFLRPLLELHRFRSRATGLFTIELSRDVIGWLGLNAASRLRVGEIGVNPIVGVRHQRLERLVASLAGRKFHAYVPPTISRPLYMFLPTARYRNWEFRRGEPMQETASDLASAVVSYGLPFMRQHLDLPELYRALEEGWAPSLEQLRERRLAFLLFAGDHSRAVAELQRELDALGDATYPAARDFRQFAERFRAEMKKQ